MRLSLERGVIAKRGNVCVWECVCACVCVCEGVDL